MGFSRKLTNDNVPTANIKAILYKPIGKVELTKTVQAVLNTQEENVQG